MAYPFPPSPSLPLTFLTPSRSPPAPHLTAKLHQITTAVARGAGGDPGQAAALTAAGRVWQVVQQLVTHTSRLGVVPAATGERGDGGVRRVSQKLLTHASRLDVMSRQVVQEVLTHASGVSAWCLQPGPGKDGRGRKARGRAGWGGGADRAAAPLTHLPSQCGACSQTDEDGGLR